MQPDSKSPINTMRLFFAEGYHGGFTMMGRWGKRGFAQAPLWNHDEAVPRWLFEEVFRRLDSFPGHKTALEVEAITFEYWEKRKPELIRELVRRINQGQMEIVDGTYTQPFGHTLGHESIVRQFLHGQETLERITGRQSRTHYKQEHLFVPNLPGLLRSAGFTSAVLRAHIHHFSCCPEIDHEFILWQGRDGQTIPTIPNYFMTPYPYALGGGTPQSVEQFLDAMEAAARSRGVGFMLLSHGLDIVHDDDFIRKFKREALQNPEMIAVGERLCHGIFLGTDWPEMGISDEKLKILSRRGYQAVLPSAFFDNYKTEGPRVGFDADYFRYSFLWGNHGDQLMTAIKSAESLLHATGVVQALLRLLGTTGDEQDWLELDDLWKRVLQAQSHDIHVCPNSFSQAISDFPVRMGIRWCRQVREKAETTLRRNATDLISHAVKPGPQPRLILFNPLSFHRNDPVEVTLTLPRGFAKGFKLYNGQGEIPYDCLRSRRYSDGSICRADLALPCDVPGLGFAQIDVEPDAGLSELRRVHPPQIDTGLIRAVLTENGTLTHLTSCGNTEYISSDFFEANEITARFPEGWASTRNGQGRLECHQGRFLTQFLALTRLGDKVVRAQLRFYQHSARIDFSTEIDFGLESYTDHSDGFTGTDPDYFGAVRATFNPAFANEFYSDFPLSVECSKRSLAPGQSFGCITNNRLGLTLINRGNIGYYRNPEKGVGLSLILASGSNKFIYGTYPLSGKITFQYTLISHLGNWKAGSVRQAGEVHNPILSATVSGNLDKEFCGSLLSVAPETIMVTALIERKGSIYLRLWNSSSDCIESELVSGFDLAGVFETDIFGKNKQAVRVAKNKVFLSFKPFELKTLLLAVPHDVGKQLLCR